MSVEPATTTHEGTCLEPMTAAKTAGDDRVSPGTSTVPSLLVDALDSHCCRALMSRCSCGGRRYRVGAHGGAHWPRVVAAAVATTAHARSTMQCFQEPVADGLASHSEHARVLHALR